LIVTAWFKLTVNPPHPPVFSISAARTKIRVDEGNYSLQTVTAFLSSGANDTFVWQSNVTQTLPSCATDFILPQGSFPISSSMNVTCALNAALTNKGNFTLVGLTEGTYSEVLVRHTLLISVNVTRTHDLAVSSTAISKGFSYAGVSLGSTGLKFNVTVSNNGAGTETSIVVNGTAKTKLVTDSHIGFLDKNGNGVWNSGEPVTYDPDGRNGPPSIGNVLKTDSNIRYVETDANTVWDSGESVVYDSNSDGLYSAGEPTISNSTVISVGTSLSGDPLLKFVDTSGNNIWEPGEPVVYDKDMTNAYSFGDTVIVSGFLTWVPGERIIANSTVIPVNSRLSVDQSIKYVDAHYNHVWTVGDQVAIDTNANGLYDSGEAMVAGSPPSNGYLVGSQSVTLTAGQTSKVTLTWDTATLPRATYTIEGSIAPVPQEFILNNNNVFVTSFTQRLKGDVSSDCKVDIVDLATVGSTFGKTLGTVGYNPAADLNNDGKIDIVDLVLVAGVFGSVC